MSQFSTPRCSEKAVKTPPPQTHPFLLTTDVSPGGSTASFPAERRPELRRLPVVGAADLHQPAGGRLQHHHALRLAQEAAAHDPLRSVTQIQPADKGKVKLIQSLSPRSGTVRISRGHIDLEHLCSPFRFISIRDFEYLPFSFTE